MKKKSSSEADPFSTNQANPRILWNQNYHFCFHNSPLLVPILSQINPVRAPKTLFLYYHLLFLRFDVQVTVHRDKFL